LDHRVEIVYTIINLGPIGLDSMLVVWSMGPIGQIQWSW